MSKLTNKQLIIARKEFNSFLLVEKEHLPKLKLKTPLEFFSSKKMNTHFESICSIAYNSTFEELTATIKIKQSSGYSSNLCKNGTYEYVRFYLDYMEGNGWEDMGFVGLNVHDIPTLMDCDKHAKKPIDYVVRLKIEPKKHSCHKANLPKVKAVLSWNMIPAENDPNLTSNIYFWGDVKEERIQIDPIPNFIKIKDFPLGGIVEKLIKYPNLSLNDLSLKNPNINLKNTLKMYTTEKVDFLELAENNKKVKPHRFASKLLKEASETTDHLVSLNIKNLFKSKNLSFSESFLDYNKLNCNTDYEELLCVGADYNRDALVGTFKIKKPQGYNGELCKKGSKEYVSFWIKKNDKCNWFHAGTTFVNVHDIKKIPKGGLFYSVVLPYNFNKLADSCKKPQVMKVRAILSWHTPAKDKECSTWGNIIESYIQIRPKLKTGKKPLILSVGGVLKNSINNLTGLTLPNSKIKLTKANVSNNSPFGGLIIITAKTDPFVGQKYKVKITNLTKGGSYYLRNSLTIDGYNGINATSTVIIPNGIDGDEYEYMSFEENNDHVIARFYPGTNDKLRITIENLKNGTIDSQIIQMHNLRPKVKIDIDDNGNCTHYNKGAIITGEFTVFHKYLKNFSLTTNVGNYMHISGLNRNGTVNGTGKFEIKTDINKNCGNIYLKANEKTIWDSVTNKKFNDTQKIICLK